MDPRFMQNGFDKRLSHLIEEGGEVLIELGRVLAAAGKTQRWGTDSYNPDLPPEQRETNIDWLKRGMGELERELDDLKMAIARLWETL